MYKDVVKEKFNNLKKTYKSRDVIVLGIESSCDETSIAVVKNGREILSNVIATQIEIHARFGGVVPEVASRNHLLAIDSVLDEALAKAKPLKEKLKVTQKEAKLKVKEYKANVTLEHKENLAKLKEQLIGLQTLQNTKETLDKGYKEYEDNKKLYTSSYSKYPVANTVPSYFNPKTF